jgi:uncharacterized protein YuzE
VGCRLGILESLRIWQRIQAMKLEYHCETDSLYVDLISAPSAESQEISEGIVLDYDADGNLVGIDIDNASRNLGVDKTTLSKFSPRSKP